MHRIISDGPKGHYKCYSKLTRTEHGARKLCWGRGPLWTGLVTSQGDTRATSTIRFPGGRNLALSDSLQGFAQGCYSW